MYRSMRNNSGLPTRQQILDFIASSETATVDVFKAQGWTAQ